MIELIKPTYKKLLNDINKLNCNQNETNTINFFKQDLLFLFIVNKDEEYNLNELFKNLNNVNKLIVCLDITSLTQTWNELIYEIKLHNKIGDNMFKLIKLYFNINHLSFEKIGKEEYIKNNSYTIYDINNEASIGVFTNNIKLLNNKPIIENYILEFLNKFRNNKIKKQIRTPLTKSIRLEVLKRDNYKCLLCGSTKNDTTLEIDHILPVSRGGKDTMDNLRVLCKSCNRSKSNRITD